MELVFCITGGLAMIGGGIALAFVRSPQWALDADTSTKSGRTLQRVIGFQRGVRRSTNILLGLTGGIMLLCAFVPHGRTWMALWLLIFLALLAVMLLAGLDAISSMVGYRQAIPEAARRSFAARQPNP